MLSNKLRIFSNQAGQPLAESISTHLLIEPGQIARKLFADGEIMPQIGEDVRGCDTFVVMPTNPPAENFWEALLIIDALHQASARRVTAVVPYAGNNRQDRKDKPRVPRSALVMFRALRISGIERALFLDLHSEATAGYLDNVKVDHLYGSKIIVPRLRDLLVGQDFIIASPDKGGAVRADKYAEFLNQDGSVMFSKRRGEDRKVREVKIIGDVRGKIVVLVDDIIDTAGTMVSDAIEAMKAGAADVWAIATHGLFSDEAVKNIEKSPISRIMVTDTVSTAAEKISQFAKTKAEILSSAHLLALAINRIHNDQSVSQLIMK